LAAVWQIPKQGQDGVKVDGIEHEVTAFAERLQSRRAEVIDKGDRAG
jgi:hypothetical protein